MIDHTPAGPLRRCPSDVARRQCLLSSPQAAFVTGQTLVVDGGYSIFGAAHPASRAFGETDA